MKRGIWVSVTIGCATAFGLAGAVQEYVSFMPGDPPPLTFGHALIMETPYWYLWALLAPAMVWFVRRHPFERATLRADVPRHIAFALAITGVQTVAHVWFMHAIGHGFPRGEPFLPNLLLRARIGFIGNLVAYVLIAALIIAVLYYQRFRDRETTAARLATQLAEAQLQALRMQLNPHFLFNALNAVSMLVRQDDGAAAVRMLGRLGGLLRTMLEEAPAHEWRLADELRFIEKYLAIEQARFGDRLRIDITAPAELHALCVPILILQPLVENAIRHGIAKKVDAGLITIRCSRAGEDLLIELEDDGGGFDTERGNGIGLENTRARLEHLYDDRDRLNIAERPGRGVRATLRIPLHMQPAFTTARA